MSKSLFVGNIAYGAMECEVSELFSSCGTVQDVHFIIDHRKGRFCGYGFVTMDAKEADKAIDKLNGMEFQGRSLKVSEASSSKKNPKVSA